jgi:hypothetical protein
VVLDDDEGCKHRAAARRLQTCISMRAHIPRNELSARGQHLSNRMAEEIKFQRVQPPSAVGGDLAPHLPTLGGTDGPLLAMVHGEGQRDERHALPRHPPDRNSTHQTPPTLFHPQTGTTKLLHLSAATGHILLANLTSLVTASHQGVEEGTHQRYHLAWYPGRGTLLNF